MSKRYIKCCSTGIMTEQQTENKIYLANRFPKLFGFIVLLVL